MLGGICQNDSVLPPQFNPSQGGKSSTEKQTLLHHVRGGRHLRWMASLIWLWLKVSAGKPTYWSIKLMCVCSCMSERHSDREQRGRSWKRLFFHLFEIFICSVGRLIILLSHCVYSGIQTELKSSLAFLLLNLFDRRVFVCLCFCLCACVWERGREKEGEIWYFTWWPHTYPSPSSRSFWRGEAETQADQIHSSNNLPGSWFAYTRFP